MDGELKEKSEDTNEEEWIPAAREGQVIEVADEICTLTREGIESSLGTWKGGRLFDNHLTLRSGLILDEKFESPYLMFKLSNNVITALSDGAGGSIDALAMLVKDKKIMKMKGIGYSVLSKGITPSCTKEAGCGIPFAAYSSLDDDWAFNASDYTIDQLEVACAWKDLTKDRKDRTPKDYKYPYCLPDGTVSPSGVKTAMSSFMWSDDVIPSGDIERVYTTLKSAFKSLGLKTPFLELRDIYAQAPGRGYLKLSDIEKYKEEDIKRMTSEEDMGKNVTVTYTPEQVAEIRAAAVAEVSEQLTNQYKVETGESEKVHKTELETQNKAHADAMEAQRIEITEHATVMETLATKYGLTDEQKKTLMDAKTLKEGLALFSMLDVKKESEVVAAKGASEQKSGIIMGGAAPSGDTKRKVMKIEEVGNFNAKTKEYEPTYREEVID
jgi:hypothetical protein